jgi:hypothetical protein
MGAINSRTVATRPAHNQEAARRRTETKGNHREEGLIRCVLWCDNDF